MGGSELGSGPVENGTKDRNGRRPGAWSARYGAKHRLHRVAVFPAGILPPKRVRIYLRAGHYVLQWWDPAARTNLSDRVDGDLVVAITRARQVEQRLADFKSSGLGQRRLGHIELVQAFLQDLSRRADAGEINPATVTRYRSALAHYTAFATQPEIARAFPHAAGAGREFRLALAAFLGQRSTSPNGHPNARPRPMRHPAFVEGAVRALFSWAADPDRGSLLPAGFRNPFLRSGRRSSVPCDLAGEPDITTAMAEQFLLACDTFQLKLFAPMILYGLRAAEPCMLFGEHLGDGWLRVPCIEALAYQTKGRRDKRFPWLACLAALWQDPMPALPEGLLFLRRGVLSGQDKAPLRGASLECLGQEFQRRCAKVGRSGAAGTQQIRHQLLRDAGGLSYDHIDSEFRSLAGRLGWQPLATLKDFRHLFSSLLENGGMPEYYRRYLMGHAPGKTALVHYTHLNQIRQQFERAVASQFGMLVQAVERRASQLRSSG
jgi:hypothetical protein